MQREPHEFHGCLHRTKYINACRVTVEDYETAEFLGFRESLTEGYEADKVIEMIGGYLRKVEQYIGDLRKIFPDDTDDPGERASPLR